MKKAGKGLIISSIAMVLVVAVSLVTSTFAWFSSQATANVTKLNISTASAEGLQIALAQKDDSTHVYTSGEATIVDGMWAGADGTGWGQVLDFDAASATDAQYFGVTGIGLDGKMYKAKGSDINATTGIPGIMESAVANVDYFEAYIALNNINAGASDIFIENLSVGTDLAAATASAASMRIAISSGYDSTGLDSFAVEKTGNEGEEVTVSSLYVINPYSDAKYNKGTNAWTVTQSQATDSFLTVKSEVTFETGVTVYKDNFDSNVLATQVTALGGTYKYASGTTITGLNEKATFSIYKSGKLALVSALEPQTPYFVRVVIWFEGEDNECVQAFAGLSSQVSIEFGYTEL